MKTSRHVGMSACRRPRLGLAGLAIASAGIGAGGAVLVTAGEWTVPPAMAASEMQPEAEPEECGRIVSYIDVAVRSADTPRTLTGLYAHARRNCAGDRLMRSMGVNVR